MVEMMTWPIWWCRMCDKVGKDIWWWPNVLVYLKCFCGEIYGYDRMRVHGIRLFSCAFDHMTALSKRSLRKKISICLWKVLKFQPKYCSCVNKFIYWHKFVPWLTLHQAMVFSLLTSGHKYEKKRYYVSKNMIYDGV